MKCPQRIQHEWKLPSWQLQLVTEDSGQAKRIRLLWSAIYWVSPRLESIESVSWVCGCKRVSEQILVDQANAIHRNSWMTELEIEELERKVTGSDSVIEGRSVEVLPDHGSRRAAW